MKKPKILLVGWEHWQQELMLEKELKKLNKGYEILFAEQPNSAFMQIASSLLVDKRPISGIVFNRPFLVVRTAAAKLINDFAESCNDSQMICSISMITSDQDTEAKHFSIISSYAKVDDWDQVLSILKNNIK